MPFAGAPGRASIVREIRNVKSKLGYLTLCYRGWDNQLWFCLGPFPLRDIWEGPLDPGHCTLSFSTHRYTTGLLMFLTVSHYALVWYYQQRASLIEYGGLLFDPLKTHGVIYEYGAVFFGPLKTDGLNYGDGGINFCPIKNRRRELWRWRSKFLSH